MQKVLVVQKNAVLLQPLLGEESNVSLLQG